jgi:hypothetical protein
MSSDQQGPAAPGPKGDKGDTGAPGLSRPVRRALVFLFATAAALALVAFLAVIQQYRHNEGVQREQAAAQARQGRAIEEKLCSTLGALTALQPPPGNPQANPSRAFDQQLHATLAQLGPDLGCPGRP